MKPEEPGPVCVVTGGSSGIGEATVRLFTQHGWRVAFTYLRNEDGASKLGLELGDSRVAAIRADVSQERDCKWLYESVRKRFGGARVLVNNAGTTKFAPVADLCAVTPEDFHDVFAVNVVGAFLATRALEPLLRTDRRAAVVNVGSMASITGRGSSLPYVASKGALASVTLALARALAPAIRVNAVAPGTTTTDWLRRGLGDDRYDAHISRYAQQTALQAVTAPEDVAEAIWYLGAVATKITGEVLPMDCGHRLGTK